MSVAEIVGVALTFTLLGVTVGAMVAGGRATRRAMRCEERARRVDAYAGWLAARLTLTRTSVSFVAAFRALGAAQRESACLPLRRDEAQRARSAWCDAMREHEHAKASLIVRSHDSSICEKLGALDTVTPDVLRNAIDGDARSFDHLMRRLRDTDRCAIDMTLLATTNQPVQPYPLPEPLARLAASVGSIVDRLRRPG